MRWGKNAVGEESRKPPNPMLVAHKLTDALLLFVAPSLLSVAVWETCPLPCF